MNVELPERFASFLSTKLSPKQDVGYLREVPTHLWPFSSEEHRLHMYFSLLAVRVADVPPDDLRSCSLPRALLLYSLGVLAGRLLQRDGELPQH